MLTATKRIAWMTFVITVLTLVNAAAVGLALFH